MIRSVRILAALVCAMAVGRVARAEEPKSFVAIDKQAATKLPGHIVNTSFTAGGSVASFRVGEIADAKTWAQLSGAFAAGNLTVDFAKQKVIYVIPSGAIVDELAPVGGWAMGAKAVAEFTYRPLTHHAVPAYVRAWVRVVDRSITNQSIELYSYSATTDTTVN